MPTKRQLVIITGAHGGIGQALVKGFVDGGYGVVATDRVGDAPEELGAVDWVPADLIRFTEDEAYGETVLYAIRERLGGNELVALVNNAALQILGGVETLRRIEWRQTLDLNLVAPFLLTQSFLPELEAAGGCVVNIGSIHARLTKKDFVAYATSKAALAGLTRAMAVDLGPRVRVNAIEPAAIDTDMLRVGFEGKPEAFAQLAQCHPQQRLGQPEEVAKLALAMVGGGMNFLHGACVELDGGISARLFDPD